MMRLMMALMPSCQELAEALSGEGLASLPWPRRLMARMHLSRCALCGRFARQLSVIKEALQASWARPTDGGVESLRKRVLARLRTP